MCARIAAASAVRSSFDGVCAVALINTARETSESDKSLINIERALLMISFVSLRLCGRCFLIYEAPIKCNSSYSDKRFGQFRKASIGFSDAARRALDCQGEDLGVICVIRVPLAY